MWLSLATFLLTAQQNNCREIQGSRLEEKSERVKEEQGWKFFIRLPQTSLYNL